MKEIEELLQEQSRIQKNEAVQERGSKDMTNKDFQEKLLQYGCLARNNKLEESAKLSFELIQSFMAINKESKMLPLTKEQREEFEKLSKPLIKFLNDNLDPHCKIIIECDYAEILSGLCGIPTDEFIKD